MRLLITTVVEIPHIRRKLGNYIDTGMADDYNMNKNLDIVSRFVDLGKILIFCNSTYC